MVWGGEQVKIFPRLGIFGIHKTKGREINQSKVGYRKICSHRTQIVRKKWVNQPTGIKAKLSISSVEDYKITLGRVLAKI